jgi:hypothetical protein
MKSKMFRVMAGAVLLGTIGPSTTIQIANAQSLERYSAESLWLSQTVSAMQNFVRMLGPVYDVTSTMTRDYPDRAAFESEASLAVASARSQLAMIHDDAVWLIGLMPERPETSNPVASALIERVGNPVARAEQVRIMTDSVISNFELAMKNDLPAMDQGILDAVALFDELLEISRLVSEIEAAQLQGGNRVMLHANRANKATVDAVVRVRQLEFLNGMTEISGEYDRVLGLLVDSIKETRAESQKVTHEGSAYRRQLQGKSYTPDTEYKLLDTYLETEKLRAKLVRSMEDAVYQFSREDYNEAALNRSLRQVYDYVLDLNSDTRNYRMSSGQPGVYMKEPSQ